MKKLLVLSLLCCCFSPVYAQRSNVWPNLTELASQVRLRVERLAIQRQLRQSSGPYLQIMNAPSRQPSVKLGTTMLPFNTHVSPNDIVPAKILKEREIAQSIFPGETLLSAMYIPEALNTEEDVMFRGLRLYTLTSVQNILQNGIQYKKVSPEFERKIYFTGWVFRALNFAYSAPVDTEILPTIVKFRVPKDDRNIYARNHIFSVDYYYWAEDVRAEDIQDVMVFLEVDRKLGWYKATLENGQLVLTPAPSRVFTDHEIKGHKIAEERLSLRVPSVWDY